MKKIIFAIVLSSLLMGSCSKKNGSKKLEQDVDSVAYIMGMNIATQLLKMDSTININAVCQGIFDVADKETRLTMEEGKEYFLRYHNYMIPQKKKAYEEQFLEDIAKSNRAFARSSSGVTYAVSEIGDQDLVPASERDTVVIRYTIRTVEGKQIYSSYERKDSSHIMLRDMPRGVRESIRLIGEGGKIETWIPADMGYGAEGNEELGIAPNTTLYYEIELLKVDKYMHRYRK